MNSNQLCYFLAASLLMLLAVAAPVRAAAPQTTESENPDGIWNVVVVVPDIEAVRSCAR